MCSVMMQRSLFEEVNGFSTDPRLLYRGDYELELRLALKAEAIALPDVLVRVLEHAGRITNGLKDGQERTALAYEIFLDTRPEKELKHLAKRRQASHLAEAASRHLSNGGVCHSLQGAIGKGTCEGAGWKQWLAALYHGVKPVLKTG